MFEIGWSHYEPGSVVVPWTTAILGSFIVGLSGLMPVLLLPNAKSAATASNANTEHSAYRRNLNRQLSFAFGGLLGDVFLHLIPEAYGSSTTQEHQVKTGLFLILGILAFLLIEKVFKLSSSEESSSNKKVVGYLNLLANCIDNFIHGLAVASSFLSSLKLGMTTVFAILVHEIPHEVGDFAILLNSGFSRFEAAKAQFGTAAVGMTGACFALYMDAVDPDKAASLWVLPFSAGGFLNIALVSVLPEMLKENDPLESIIQLMFVVLGISVMSVLCMI